MASSAHGSADAAVSDESSNTADTNDSSASASASKSTASANATSTSANCENTASSNANENATSSNANENATSSIANENVPSVEPVSTSCPVCRDDYTEPKVLPCAHRFCRKCLVTWFESSSDHPSCPICKRSAISSFDGKSASADGKEKSSPNQVTIKDASNDTLQTSAASSLGACGGQSLKMPNTGKKETQEKKKAAHTSSDAEAVADSLPTDLILAALAESARKLRPPHVCSVCPDNGMHAVEMCLDCGDMLCRRCSPFHSRLSATRHHEVQLLCDLTPEKLASRVRETCESHAGQLVELYCLSHDKLLCLVCFATSHSQCGTVQSISDASKQQRQVLQGQLQQLAELSTTLEKTSLSIQRQQEQLSESQVQVQQKVSLMIDRIVTAANARKDQLMKQAKDIPLSLKTNLQQRKGEVDESRWLLSANQQLVTDSLQSASDINFLRVFGFLSARAALLASRIKEPSNSTSTDQCAALSIDHYDVLRVEELLRDLGSVEIVKRDTEKNAGQSSLPRAPAASGPVTAKDFNPFLCRPRETYRVNMEGEWLWSDLLCEAGHNTLLLYEQKDNSVYSVCMSYPFQNRLMSVLPTAIQAMACLQEGLVVMTTKTPSLLFFDIITNPEPTVTTVPVSKVYRGVTKGLEDTIVVNPEKKRNTLDIITRGGQILRTLSLGPSVVSEESCRLKDYIIVSDMKTKTLLKVGLETGRIEKWSEDKFYSNYSRDRHKLFVDHKDRLYFTNFYTTVIVMNLEGQKKEMYLPNCMGFFVNPEGYAFTLHPSPPAYPVMLVYDLNKY